MSRDLRTFRSRLVAALAFAAAPCLASACCTAEDSVITVPIFDPDAGFADVVDADGATTVDDAGAATIDAAAMDPVCQMACLQRGCGSSGELVGCSITTSSTGRAAHCTFHRVSCPTHPALVGPVCGRRPEGLAPASSIDCDSPSDVFARLAWLESASVPAFARLADELRAHGAPASLVRAAHRAERDEIRHAHAMRSFARDVAIAPIDALPDEIRDLESIALENVREGCVRETLGALVAAYQADHAETDSVRHAMRLIAHDEAMHAWLAAEIDRWIDTRLDDAARARVASARRDAIIELETSLPGVARDDASRAAGLPDEAALRALIRGARERVWS